MQGGIVEQYKYLLLVLLIGVIALVGGYYAVRRRTRSGQRSIWDYVFLWPLLTSKKGADGKANQAVNNRVIIGWGIVFLLLIVAFAFGL
jgi:hypothetical protein